MLQKLVYLLTSFVLLNSKDGILVGRRRRIVLSRPLPMMTLNQAGILLLPGQNAAFRIPSDTFVVHLAERGDAQLKTGDECHVDQLEGLLLPARPMA
jgi:hypothetical protein